MSDRLAGLIAARLDDDEAIAHVVRAHEHLHTYNDTDLQPVSLSPGYQTVGITSGRVLAQVEAMRRIVDLHTGEHGCPDENGRPSHYGPTRRGPGAGPCPTLRALAGAWSSHPEFFLERINC